MTWLTDSSNINKQSSITGLGELSAIYGYLKNKNRQKQQFQEKNWARNVPKVVKNEFFIKNFSVLNYFFNSNENLFFIIIISKNQIRTNSLEPRVFEKTCSINAINFISFQRNPLNTQNYASMGQQVGLTIIFCQ